MNDDTGQPVNPGDRIRFNYGIPPVAVTADIIQRGGKLVGLCPGHHPPEFNLRSLRRYVGNWYKIEDE